MPAAVHRRYRWLGEPVPPQRPPPNREGIQAVSDVLLLGYPLAAVGDLPAAPQSGQAAAYHLQTLGRGTTR